MGPAAARPQPRERRLYLVRHGQTASSARGAYSGHTDIPLTETGREQARRAGERLAEAGVDAVCFSPLLRAAETAEAIGRATGAPLRIDDRLVEVDYGPLEGLDRDGALERFGARFENWRLDPYGSPLPGIEPLDEVLRRARSATSEALAAFERPVLVGHQGILRLILVVLGQIEPSAYFSTRVPEAEPIEIAAPAIRSG